MLLDEFPQDRTAHLTDMDGSSSLCSAIAALEPMYRDVILLKFSAGFHTREIAQMLSISAAAVRQRISRAKKMLIARLQEEGKDT